MAQNMAFPASKKIDYLIRLTNREFWSNSIISDRLGEQELRCCNMFVLLSVERNPLDAENTQDNDGICQSFHPKIRLKIGNRPRSSRVFELNLHAFDGLEAQEIKGFDTLANFHSRIGNSSRIWYQFQHRVHGLKSI